MDRLQDRGEFFSGPGDEVYMGMIIGEHIRPNDLVINLTEAKKQSNVRASGSDDALRIVPKTIFSLEESLEYIQGDEYVEVTPGAIRLRKIMLDENDRKRASNQKLAITTA